MTRRRRSPGGSCADVEGLESAMDYGVEGTGFYVAVYTARQVAGETRVEKKTS